jgi:hypothetical protein
MENTTDTLYGKIVSLLDSLQSCYTAEGAETKAPLGAWILDRYYPGTEDLTLRSEEDPHKIRSLVIQRWVHGRLSMDILLARQEPRPLV